MFGGTSAPSAADDAAGIYASENMTGGGIGGTTDKAGCAAPAGTTVQLIRPPGVGTCKMDGAAGITCGGMCPKKPQFKYVDNSTGTLNPYLDMATQYGWANYMFQTTAVVPLSHIASNAECA
jgi:hypothetical protein